MNRNVEIKARLPDPEQVIRQIEEIANTGPICLDQQDTFFNCPRGRLKLRMIADSAAELIYYVRPDSTEPSESNYIRSLVHDPASLFELLSKALGVRGAVNKRRMLYIAGQTRIHLDEVEGLGAFIELEVMLRPEQDTGEGLRIAREFIGSLGILGADLVDKAYIDLLEEADG
jgi:predicted adenylyl cyclase CyaB